MRTLYIRFKRLIVEEIGELMQKTKNREIEKSKLVHGGDWLGFEEEFGYEALDFSVNVSPLGLADSIKKAVIDSLDNVDRYPDPLCRRLTREIGKLENVEPSYCMCGNGADDLIFRLVAAKKPRKALITAPTFAEYASALEVVGCEIEEFPLKEADGFRLGKDIIERVDEGIDCIFLCEPNNPTGVTSPRALLVELLSRCEKVGTLLIIDECFVDFLDEPKNQTMAGFINEYKNLFILKSFTKLYAMAGIRLGYCLCSDENLLEKMRRSGQEWAVSIPAENAGLAAIKEKEYVDKLKCLIKSERVRVRRELVNLGITKVYGEADYLLFYSDVHLADKLRAKGILIRKCDNYSGLGPGWFRLGLKKEVDNDRLIEAMREVLL